MTNKSMPFVQVDDTNFYKGDVVSAGEKQARMLISHLDLKDAYRVASWFGADSTLHDYISELERTLK